MLRAAPPGHPLQKPTVVQWDTGAKDTGFVEGQNRRDRMPFLRLLCQVQQRRNGSVQSFNRSRTACIGNRFSRPRGDKRNGYAVPTSLSIDVCWYWSNSSKTRGYWDFCQ
jgi:hypothetical protein